MVQYKLIYGNGRGLAEPARALFNYAKVEFEDYRLPEFTDIEKIRDGKIFRYFVFFEYRKLLAYLKVVLNTTMAKENQHCFYLIFFRTTVRSNPSPCYRWPN